MYEFYGKHILAEFISIPSLLINDTQSIIEVTQELIRQSRATLVETKTYEFDPVGYTIFFILKESHVSIHAYPEFGAMFLDVFTCGHNIDPYIIATGLCEYLKPQKRNIQMIERNSPKSNL